MKLDKLHYNYPPNFLRLTQHSKFKFKGDVLFSNVLFYVLNILFNF